MDIESRRYDYFIISHRKFPKIPEGLSDFFTSQKFDDWVVNNSGVDILNDSVRFYSQFNSLQVVESRR